MKFRAIHIAIIVVLAIIVLLSTSAGATFVPYSKDSLFSREFAYEGMCNAAPTLAGSAQAAPVEPEPVAAQVTAPAQAQKKPELAPASSFMDSVKSWFAPLSKETPSTDAKKVEGFALQPAPFAESKPLDRYSQTPSGPQCIGQGSGYSNSLGPLCMSEEDKLMLSTRGGNASGKSAMIGTSSA